VTGAGFKLYIGTNSGLHVPRDTYIDGGEEVDEESFI